MQRLFVFGVQKALCDTQFCNGSAKKKHPSHEMSTVKRKESVDGYSWRCSKCGTHRRRTQDIIELRFRHYTVNH